MGFNKDFYLPTAKINWDGQEVCTVHGVSADDIARVMSENAGDLETVIRELVDDNKANLPKNGTPAEMQAAIMEKTDMLFGSVLRLAPALVVKVIAVGTDAEDDQHEIIRKLPMPLQFNILKETARLSFVDRGGFKEFLGNVSGLLESMGEPADPQIPASPSTDG